MIEELRRHGYNLSPGTLYPTLHKLEQAGYLASERRVIGGRVRRYYRLTERGQQALATEYGMQNTQHSTEVIHGSQTRRPG